VVTASIAARVLLAEQLRQLDEIDWTVVSGDTFDDAPETLTARRVPMRRELAPSDVTAVVRLWRLFRRERFDFVQTHTPKASMLGLPAARLAGRRTLYTMHGSLYFRDNTRLANLAGWMFERWCCSWAHLVLMQSEEDTDVVRAAHICPADKVRYVGNGISLDRFLAYDARLPDRMPPTVTMVSRLVAEKGCLEFFAVAEALRGKARFVHVGPAEHDQSDAVDPAVVDGLSKSGTVTFVGEVDDVRPYIADADIVLLPSFREGIPRVAMEAAAMGRPVVGYDVRGVREVVPPSTGLLAPRGDRQALLGVMRDLVEDGRRRKNLGVECREAVAARFSEQNVMARLRRVYAEL
jgi:glycosyltransferase involved in cell wall biosynthesis